METSPTTQTTLTIYCTAKELDFDAVTRLVGRPPNETRSLGHRTKAGTTPPAPISQWTISCDPKVLDSVSLGVSQVLDTVSDSLASMREFCVVNGYGVRITSRVRIRDWDDRPFLELGRSVIERLAKIGAEWQLDLIDLSR